MVRCLTHGDDVGGRVGRKLHAGVGWGNKTPRKGEGLNVLYLRVGSWEPLILLYCFRLYCTVEEPDLAINMYKKLRQVNIFSGLTITLTLKIYYKPKFL